MEVLTAADGATGLDLLRERSPDLVVLDIMLPGLDGLEVLRRARVFSDAYVILLTARAEELDRIVGLSVGADDYLVKPFSPRTVAGEGVPPTARQRGKRESSSGELGSTTSGHQLRGGVTSHIVRPPRRYEERRGLRRQRSSIVWAWIVGDDHVVDVHWGTCATSLATMRLADVHRDGRGVGYRFR
jgi:DNA-binding response OmpR family regulator